MQFPILKTAIVGFALFVSGSLVFADAASQMREKAHALQKQAAELSEKGQKEGAEKLERVSRELLEKAERQEANGRKTETRKEAAEVRHNPDVQQLKELLADMIAAQQKANESGAEQESKELAEQIAQTERKLTQLTSQHGEPGKRGDPGKHRDVPEQFRAQVEQLEMAARRMHHVRVAAENLKAAEMHDLAQELTQRAAAMEQEIHSSRAALAEQMHAERKAEGIEPKGDVGEGEVRELRSQNERLRAELNELREAVESLKNKQERE